MTEPAYTFRQSDLPKLDLHIDRGTDFGAWQTQWESYCSLSGLGREAATKQVKALTLCFSREMLSIVQNLGLTEDQMKDTGAIIDAMQKYITNYLVIRTFYVHCRTPIKSLVGGCRKLCMYARIIVDYLLQQRSREWLSLQA